MQIVLAIVALVCLLLSTVTNAQRMPQDNWGRGGIVCCAGEIIYGHDFDQSGNLFLATNRLGGRLIKLDRRFVEVASVPISPTPSQVRTDALGQVYVAFQSVITRYSNTLTTLGSVTIPSPVFTSFEILNDGGYVVAHSFGGSGSKLRSYDATGVFIREFGTACAIGIGAICFVKDLDVFPSGEILVSNSPNSNGDQRYYILTFKPDGTLLTQTSYTAPLFGGGIAILPGGGFVLATGSAPSNLAIFSTDPRIPPGAQAYLSLDTQFLVNFDTTEMEAMRVRASPSGDLVFAGQGAVRKVVHMPVGFRSLGPRFGPLPLPARPAIPQPRVVSVQRQTASTVVDISLLVIDEDDSTSDLRVLGVRSGATSLANIIKISTLVNGTGSNIGPGTPTGVLRTISWDAAADIGTTEPLVSLGFQALAKDARGMIDLDFVGIPANMPTNGSPAMVITRSPITESQLLDVWFWLIAGNDARINFANGEVRGVNGVYANQLLASGASTTSLGRQFIFGDLLVQEATPAQIARAREASTPGVVNQFTPVNGMPYLISPLNVNQFGIDTATTGGYWVVMP